MCVCVCVRAASFTFCCCCRRRRRCRQNQIPLLINIRRHRHRHPYLLHPLTPANYPLYIIYVAGAHICIHCTRRRRRRESVTRARTFLMPHVLYTIGGGGPGPFGEENTWIRRNKTKCLPRTPLSAASPPPPPIRFSDLRRGTHDVAFAYTHTHTLVRARAREDRTWRIMFCPESSTALLQRSPAFQVVRKMYSSKIFWKIFYLQV